MASNKLGPPGGKKYNICFIDDLNMPKVDLFGSQPPLELVRQWMDYTGWFDRTKQTFKEVHEMKVIAAMGPPSGARAVISRRLQSHFNLINFTKPSEQQIRRIYSIILKNKLQEFDEEVKPLDESLAMATLMIYNRIRETFLPIPSKCHYVFNMRDMSKVVQGIRDQANKGFHDSREQMVKLWAHECLRVFHDRLVSEEDRSLLKQLMDD